jgi:alpha-beta hydrolase superfamily lysophospholipase
MTLSRRSALGLLALAGPALALPAGRVPAPSGGARLEEAIVSGVPLRLWLPDGMGAASRLIVFSHGANANASKYDALTRAWADEGHAVAAILHADSPDHPGGGKIGRPEAWQERLSGMRTAMAELAHRYPGVPQVAAGHSYGALVAQALGGAP